MADKVNVQRGKEENGLEISTQIKKYRGSLGLSQEELAEKIYVSRQTISNWETGKNYPDIHSLLLLSSLFNISLDQLIRGDVEIMREQIKENEITKFNRYGTVFSILLLACVILAVPLAFWLGVYAFIPWGCLFAVTIFFAYKVEKIKKDNNIYTYKEITMFMDGKRLDEMEQWREEGKRPYQKFLLAVGSGLITLILCLILHLLFEWIF